MPYTPNYAAGDVLTAAAMNSIGEAWQTYTVSWTATGTPAVGNGTLTGYYCQINKVVFGRVNLTAGTTTTYGTGNWYFSLPVTARSLYASNDPIGQGMIVDFATKAFSPILCVINNTTSLGLYYSRTTVNISALNNNFTFDVFGKEVKQGEPLTFGSQDTVQLSFAYEAA